MKNKDTEKTTLIDYEYACMNPLGWDVVNFFCERIFTYDELKNKFGVDMNIPRTNERRLIFKYYLLKMAQHQNPDFGLALDLDSEHFMADLSSDKFDKLIDLELLQQFTDDFYEIMSVINYFWIIWCGLLVSDSEERWPVVDYTCMRVSVQQYLQSKDTASPQK